MHEVGTLFDRLGFAPRRADAGGRHHVLLDACPFRDIARSHTAVVCTAHPGLLRGVLDRLGGGPAEAQLRPFVEPELCIADVSFPAGAPDPLAGAPGPA